MIQCLQQRSLSYNETIKFARSYKKEKKSNWHRNKERKHWQQNNLFLYVSLDGFLPWIKNFEEKFKPNLFHLSKKWNHHLLQYYTERTFIIACGCNAVRYCTIEYSTGQFRTVWYGTVEYSTPTFTWVFSRLGHNSNG